MNTIREVCDGNNVVHTTPRAMGHTFIEHFSSILILKNTVNYDEGGLFDVLDAIKIFYFG